jgi:hypothetical protein
MSTMNKLAAAFIGAWALVVPAMAAVTDRPLIVTSQDHSLASGESDDCAHFHTRNETSLPSTATATEERTLRIAPGTVLRVRASEEGGVTVKGWDRPAARLTICKCAVAANDTQARQVLAAVKVVSTREDVFTHGPLTAKTQAWWVHMILRVPKSANIDVITSNGGIAIRNMSSRITARAKNGGISLAYCAGEQKITTQNGGISLDKISGKLDATTENGSISLKVQDGASAQIEARTVDEGEILCNLKGCSDGLGNWGADRKTLRIGTATPTIRLTTGGAPIVIEQVR